MARYQFGGRDTVVTLAASDGKTVQALIAGSTITAWDSRTGGTQYTDLQTATGTAISGGNITTTDETVPVFLGPDGITQMWLSYNSGKRYLVEANILSDLAGRITTLESGASSIPSISALDTDAAVVTVTQAGAKGQATLAQVRAGLATTDAVTAAVNGVKGAPGPTGPGLLRLMWAQQDGLALPGNADPEPFFRAMRLTALAVTAKTAVSQAVTVDVQRVPGGNGTPVSLLSAPAKLLAGSTSLVTGAGVGTILAGDTVVVSTSVASGAPAIRGTTTGSSASTSTFPIPLSGWAAAAPQAGDLLVHAFTVGDAAPTIPAGWTLSASVACAGTIVEYLHVIRRTATGSDAGNIGVSNKPIAGVTLALSGVDPSAAIDVADTTAGADANATTILTPSTTTVTSTLGGLALHFAAMRTSTGGVTTGAVSWSSGTTEVADVSSLAATAVNVVISVAWETVAAATVLPQRTATFSPSPGGHVVAATRVYVGGGTPSGIAVRAEFQDAI